MAVTCGKCGMEFVDRESLDEHMELAHGRKKRKRVLPTLDQIEYIMDHWGNKSMEEISRELNLDKTVVNNTAKLLRRAVYAPREQEGEKAYLCPRETLTDRVRTVLARHGMMLPEILL